MYVQKWFLNFEPAFSACFFKISDFLEASRKLIFNVLHKKTVQPLALLQESTVLIFRTSKIFIFVSIPLKLISYKKHTWDTQSLFVFLINIFVLSMNRYSLFFYVFPFFLLRSCEQTFKRNVWKLRWKCTVHNSFREFNLLRTMEKKSHNLDEI